MRKRLKIDNEKLIAYCKNKKSLRNIAKYFNSFETTIRRRLKALGIKKQELPRGRPKTVSKRVERSICANFNNCNFMSLQDGVNYLKEAANLTVSKQTIQRIAKRSSFSCRVRQKKPYMTLSHLRKQKLFYEKHKKWNYQNFKNYVFSDESSFQLKGFTGQKTYYLKNGASPSNKSYINTLKFGGGSIMIQAYITFKGVGKICKIEGNIDSKKYTNILEDVYFDGMCDQNMSLSKYTLVQDNAPCHVSGYTKNWFKEQNINALV